MSVICDKLETQSDAAKCMMHRLSIIQLKASSLIHLIVDHKHTTFCLTNIWNIWPIIITTSHLTLDYTYNTRLSSLILTDTSDHWLNASCHSFMFVTNSLHCWLLQKPNRNHHNTRLLAMICHIRMLATPTKHVYLLTLKMLTSTQMSASWLWYLYIDYRCVTPYCCPHLQQLSVYCCHNRLGAEGLHLPSACRYAAKDLWL